MFKNKAREDLVKELGHKYRIEILEKCIARVAISVAPAINAMKLDPLRCLREKKITRVTLALVSF